jgi:hypothetical protein
VTSSICRASSKEYRICIEPLVPTLRVGVDEDTVSAREHGLLRIINKWDRSGGRTERTRKTMAERLFATEKQGGVQVPRRHGVPGDMPGPLLQGHARPAGRRGWGCSRRSSGSPSTGSSRSPCAGPPSDAAASRTGSPPGLLRSNPHARYSMFCC